MDAFKPYLIKLKGFLGSRLFFKIMAAGLFAFLLYGTVMLMISPRRTNIVTGATEEIKALTPEEMLLLKDREGCDLMLQKAYLSSRMMRASDDSIGLALDISSGTIALEIKGVVLFERAIIESGLSPYFRALDDTTLFRLTAKPYAVTAFRSTIIKEPIVEKKAPKDTSEVELSDFQIDTSYREPAFLVIELDNGVEVVLKQYHGISFRDQFKYGSFIFRERMNRVGNVFHALIRGRVPRYTPRITAELSAKDIRIIYRALPQKPRISLRII